MVWSEKVDQVRLQWRQIRDGHRVPAGSVCAVTGLTRTFPVKGWERN